MARVNLLDERQADPEAAAVFEEVAEAFGRVPNLFRAQANFPPLLRTNWEKVKAVLLGGALRREVKEAIAVLVSKDNGCSYCVAAHTAALQAIGLTAEQIEALEDDLDAINFDDREQALIQFSREANRNPLTVGDAYYRALRETGASDAEIVEALGTMEIFTAFNKFLDSLQVETDF